MMYSQKMHRPTRYQVGGPMQSPQQQQAQQAPPQQGQDPNAQGGDQQNKLQQIVAQVADELQKGTHPQDIMKGLAGMGLSKKQAKQVIQMAAQQLQQAQGQQQQQQGPPPQQGPSQQMGQMQQ